MTTAPDNVKTVQDAINKHYVLPANEVPALATVTDSSKISSTFKDVAKNDDRILIYQKNKLAVIYRPSIDRVVAVIPVTIDTPQGGQSVQ